MDSWIRKFPWRKDRLPTPIFLDSSYGSAGNESTCMCETWVQSLGQEDPLEKGMATHSSILAWEIPWTGDRGNGGWAAVHEVAKSTTVSHDGLTNTHIQKYFLFIIFRTRHSETRKGYFSW